MAKKRPGKRSAAPSQTPEPQLLRRRYRAGVGVAGLLAFILLASMTAGSGVRERPEARSTGSLPGSETGAGVSGDRSAAEIEGGESLSSAVRGVGAPGTGDPAGAQGRRAGGSAAVGPSDQGVTTTEIVIAFTRIDPAFYARFGIPDPEAERGIEAYVEHVNATGGINGRQIRPVIITQSDPRFPEPSQQTCRTAFADRRAFMMINDQRWPGMAECATRMARPISDSGNGLLAATSRSFISDLGGRYWIGGMNVEQFARLWVDFIAKRLDGRKQKIGILEHYNDDLTYASEVVQLQMRRAGFRRPSVFKHTEDISTAAIQANNAMAQYQRDGVTLIVPVTNAVPAGIGQRTATSRNYYPKWTFSSIGGLDATDYAPFYDDSQFNGSTGISFERLPSQPGQEECRAIFTRRWPGSEYTSQQSGWCHIILLNAEVLRRAGPQLTLGTWNSGFASIGAYVGNHVGRSTFAPGKYDGADQVQVLRYEDGRMSSVSPFVDGF